MGESPEPSAPEELTDRVDPAIVTERRLVGAGRVLDYYFDQVRLPDGSETSRAVVNHYGGASIVALDEKQRVLLVNQYRHPVAARLWEIPSGLIKPQETPFQAAQRELQEETGYVAANWGALSHLYLTPGGSPEENFIFLATGLTQAPLEGRVAKAEERAMTVEWVPLARVLEAISRGKVHNNVTVSALMSTFHHLSTGAPLMNPRALVRHQSTFLSITPERYVDLPRDDPRLRQGPQPPIAGQRSGTASRGQVRAGAAQPPQRRPGPMRPTAGVRRVAGARRRASGG